MHSCHKDTLDFILRFVEENGYQPSQAEMAVRFGISITGIVHRLEAMAQAGIIERRDDRRALRIHGWRFRSEPLTA